mgnify:CR=1 FL=1
MGPSKPELKNGQKMKEKIEIEGTASNDTESIQIAPRDYQKLEFLRNSRFFIFHEIHKIRCRLMRSTPNHLIYHFSMALRAENGVK